MLAGIQHLSHEKTLNYISWTILTGFPGSVLLLGLLACRIRKDEGPGEFVRSLRGRWVSGGAVEFPISLFYQSRPEGSPGELRGESEGWKEGGR